MPKEFVRKRGGRRAGKKDNEEQDETSAPKFVPDLPPHMRLEAGHSDSTSTITILPTQDAQLGAEGMDGGAVFDPAAPFGYVDPDIKAYFRSVDEKLREWENIGLAPGEDGETEVEDRTNFLHNSLTELRSLELQLSTDPDCALIMERLLHSMGDWGRRVLADSFSGHWSALLQHRFGSHVCQTLFSLAAETIDREARKVFPKQHLEQESRLAEDSSIGVLRTMTQLVVDICEEILPTLPSLLISPFGSPPVRLLLLLLSPGRAVIAESGVEDDKRIRSKKSQKFRSHHGDGMKSILGEEEADGEKGIKNRGKGKQRKVPKELKKMRTKLRVELRNRMSGAEWRNVGVENVGGPAVQILLEFEAEEGACEEPNSIMDHLTGGLVSEGADHKAGDYVPSLLRDTTGSHLLQAMLAIAPQNIFKSLWDSYFVGKLGKLASHPIGNFVVSSGVKRLSKDQLEVMIQEIRAAGPTSFVRTSRTSVLQGLVDRAAKTGELQEEVVQLIVEACEIPEEKEKEMLIPCLLTLNLAKNYENAQRLANGDLTAKVEMPEQEEENSQQHGWKPRQPKQEKQALEPSMQGSLLLQGLLKLSSPASDRIMESLLAQGLSMILDMSHQAVSSHVIDAVVSSKAVSPKCRRRMLMMLDGHYFELVDDRFGSRVGDKIWEKADGFMKEKIARGLIPQAIALSNSQYGKFFARRLNLHLLQRRPDEWREAQLGIEHHFKHQETNAPRSAIQAAALAYASRNQVSLQQAGVAESEDKVEKKRKRENAEEVGESETKAIDDLFAPVIKEKKKKSKKVKSE